MLGWMGVVSWNYHIILRLFSIYRESVYFKAEYLQIKFNHTLESNKHHVLHIQSLLIQLSFLLMNTVFKPVLDCRCYRKLKCITAYMAEAFKQAFLVLKRSTIISAK